MRCSGGFITEGFAIGMHTYSPSTSLSFPRRIALLGATGSIGRQVQSVVAFHKGCFELTLLSAHRQTSLLSEAARKFNVKRVVLTDSEAYQKAKEGGMPAGIALGNVSSLLDWVGDENVDVVVVAMVGFAGLLPVLRALEAKKTVAIANKEVLVVGGALVMAFSKKYQAPVLPIDSEHSALFQCLLGAQPSEVRRLILTASGGAFWKLPLEKWKKITTKQALKHPKWDMGAKVTIDSATMMNKGLEVIEAYWLFGISPEKIDVWVHPECVVHSMVEFVDGVIKAQLSATDMRLPIQYAMGYPVRKKSEIKGLEVSDFQRFNFYPYDYIRYQAVPLCKDSLARGGTAPCVLSAADEVATKAFMEGHLSFVEIVPFVADCMRAHRARKVENYALLAEVHAEATAKAEAKVYGGK